MEKEPIQMEIEQGTNIYDAVQTAKEKAAKEGRPVTFLADNRKEKDGTGNKAGWVVVNPDSNVNTVVREFFKREKQ